MARYYNKLEHLNRPKGDKMKTFKRHKRWFYGYTDKKDIRHKNCNEDGYTFRLTAIIKGMRRNK